MAFITPVLEHWLEQEIAQLVHHEGSIQRPIASWANALTTELQVAPLVRWMLILEEFTVYIKQSDTGSLWRKWPQKIMLDRQ